MPDLKISQLTAGDPAQGTDEIPAARAGANVRVTAQSIADLASAVPSDFQPAIVTNYYYTTPDWYPAAGCSPTVGQMVAYPFWTSHAETWTRAVIVSTFAAAGAVLRAGIYDSSANKPNNLVLDFGEYDLSSAAELSKTISLALSANTLYWLVYNVDDPLVSGPGLEGGSPNTDAWVGILGDSGPLSGAVAYTKTQAYGALPASYGTPDGIQSAELVAIWLRKV